MSAPTLSGRGRVEEVPESPPDRPVASVLVSPSRPRAMSKPQKAQKPAHRPQRGPAGVERVLSLQEVCEKYNTCTEDVLEFADFLDVDPVKEIALLPTVCECINAELPPNWQECEDVKSGEVYYWNRDTDATTWDHPLDAGFRERIKTQREKQYTTRQTTGRTSGKAVDEDLYMQGKRLLGKKEYGRAIAVFTAAIASDHPELALCHNLRGVCHSWLGKHADALRDADRAVQLRPSATLFCNRGKAYRALKRYVEARADFDEALRREPGHKHAIAELSSLAAVDGSSAVGARSTTSGPPKTTSAQGEVPSDGRALEDWSVEDVTRWFKTKFAFAHKYQTLWDEQCISGALLPFLTETELKDDVEMKSSIHRNAVLRGIASLVDNEKNRGSLTPTSAPRMSGRLSSSADNQGNASTKKRAAMADDFAKPDSPSKVAKSSAEKTGVARTSETGPRSKAARSKGNSPLVAAIAEGEAAAAALKPAAKSQAAPAAGPLYSEGTTRRLRDSLKQNRQRLEGRLAALEKRSEHLGSLTAAAVGAENST